MAELIWYAGLLLIGLAIGWAYRRWQWRQWRKTQPKPAQFKVQLSQRDPYAVPVRQWTADD